MIQNVNLQKRPRIKLLPSQRLRSYFLALARQVNDWQRESTERFSIGVASLEPGQGTSTIAFNLGAALAGISNGKVLLVESEFGNPFSTRRLPRRCQGLSEILSSQTEVADAIYPTRLDNLFVMSCGQMAKKDALELPLESVASLNTEAREDFELAVFDLPHATELTHFYPLAQQLDGIVLVVEANNVDAQKVARIRNRLSDGKVIGAVVNKSK